MVVGIAVAEIIAMIVVYFFNYLPYYQQVLLDAAVMTVIIFPLLYFLSFRPLLRHVQQRYQVERILQTRLQLIQFSNTHTLNELLQFTLDGIESLTGSTMSFFLFLEADQKTLGLQTWSTRTAQDKHSVTSTNSHSGPDQAGIWADCIRQRQPVIHNDFASLPLRNAMPDGHAPIVREMVVPVFRDDMIVAVLGLGNKPDDYTQGDVELVSTLADFAWDIVKQQQTGDAIRASEEKFRTLVDWTFDWEKWIDPHGNIVYISPSCERITGYRPGEFIADPNLLVQIVHPDDRRRYEEHHQLMHDEKAGLGKVEYRVLTRGGELRWIEHVCRPLFGADHLYLGRRISSRDISERKQAEQEIKERNQKEKILTQTIHTMQLDIARDLHDTIGQNISLLRMKLDYLAGNSFRKADLKAEIRSMTNTANEAYDLIRGTLAVLQSGNSTDLFRLFSRYAEQIEERSGFKVDFSTRGEAKSLSAKRLRQIFYVFREALNNIEKHAGATQVAIDINWNDSHLVFTIMDNGKGFDFSNIQYGSHFGLKFMRERVEMLNGSMEIQSKVGEGTHILIQVPYE